MDDGQWTMDGRGYNCLWGSWVVLHSALGPSAVRTAWGEKYDDLQGVSDASMGMSCLTALSGERTILRTLRWRREMDIAKREVVVAEKAPKAIGPYSVGIRAAGMVFASGMLGLDPGTGELVPGGVEAETRQALQNVAAILESAGSSMRHVVKTTVFLRDMADFGKMNAVYAGFFGEAPPARSTVQVAALPRGGAVEIEAIALQPSA